MSTPSQSGPDLPVGDAGAGRSARLRVGVAALAAICAGVVVMLLGHPALAPLSWISTARSSAAGVRCSRGLADSGRLAVRSSGPIVRRNPPRAASPCRCAASRDRAARPTGTRPDCSTAAPVLTCRSARWSLPGRAHDVWISQLGELRSEDLQVLRHDRAQGRHSLLHQAPAEVHRWRAG